MCVLVTPFFCVFYVTALVVVNNYKNPKGMVIDKKEKEKFMAYIWSYLRRYPKWLAMNFTAAILFVIANLGLPTVLARMIDDGFQCLFDFGDKSTSRSYYFLCGRRTWHTSRIRTCGFRRKTLPKWLIPYLRNQLQWQSKLYLP